MGSQSIAITEHIREERDALGRDLRDMEGIVRDRPRRWLRKELPRILAAAFGVFFLVGFLAVSRRHR